jgi:hypothetical protein
VGADAGFERKRYRLTWAEGTSYEGLEVTTKPPSMDVLLRLDELKDGAAKGSTDDVRDLVGLFAELITGWNVTDAGQPVPVSAAELLADVPMTMAIVANYGDKVAAASLVPRPLPSRSGSSPASPADLRIPMTPVTPMTPEAADPAA